MIRVYFGWQEINHVFVLMNETQVNELILVFLQQSRKNTHIDTMKISNNFRFTVSAISGIVSGNNLNNKEYISIVQSRTVTK